MIAVRVCPSAVLVHDLGDAGCVLVAAMLPSPRQAARRDRRLPVTPAPSWRDLPGELPDLPRLAGRARGRISRSVVRGLTGLRMCPSAQAGSVVVHEGAAGPLAVRRHDHLPF